MSDAEQSAETTEQCDYCGREELAYDLESDRGNVARCIPCLAIEQGQQQFGLPFEAWLDRDDVEPMGVEGEPDFEPFDPREHDYKTARSWFQVLARITEDKPLVKRDPEAIGTIHDDTRKFLINIMGEDAHKPPSEVAGSEVSV